MFTPIPSGMNWARLSPRGGDAKYWHPLADHCIDVAACAERLLALPIVRMRLAALAGTGVFPDIWAARLAALAFLHDFGKANGGFQSRKAGHIAEAAYVLDRAALRLAAGFDAIEDWAIGGAVELLTVVLAHHGAPPDFDMIPQCDRAWSADQTRDPIGVVAALVAEAHCIWPVAFTPGGPPLPDGAASPFWHARRLSVV